MAEANLNGATLFDVAGSPRTPRNLSAPSAAARAKAIKVMGQLGKLGDETFPARILEYVACAPRCTASSRSSPTARARRSARSRACQRRRHQRPASRVPGVLEEGSERKAAFAQLRSRAHEIAVETVEKKSLSPFNDKVYGLDAHNSRPLGHWRNLDSCGRWALTLRQLRALRPCALRHCRCG